MDDIKSGRITWDSFVHQYFWVLILVIVFVLVILGVLLWYIRHCRREPRCEYTVLGDESCQPDRLEMDRKLQRDTDRNMAMIRCQYYLRDSNRYVFLHHLPDMGSRLDKNWFLVRDNTTKTERLLTMTPMAENCPIKYNADTRQVLLDLFLALQHPYIYPVLDIDRKIVMEQEYVLAILPFNDEGTIKDAIYQSKCQSDWRQKYNFHGYGLEAAQIQRLGCQILEALLFLKDQGFPPFLHLHSGNVILQNGVARISGLENTLFGYSSRNHMLIPKRMHENKEAAETICFGHLLFEMASGYELSSPHPTEKNYTDLETKHRVLDVLKYIFEQGRYRYPSLQQVASLDFFRHIDLRELRSLMPAPSIKAKLNPASRAILKEIKKHSRSRRRVRHTQSVSGIETTSIDSKDSKSSGASSRASKRKKKQTTFTFEVPSEDVPENHIQSFPHVESSSASNACVSTCGSEYYTPPTSPQQDSEEQDNDIHNKLLLEIQRGVKLKHINYPKV